MKEEKTQLDRIEDVLIFLTELIDLRTLNGSQQGHDSKYVRQLLGKE